MINLLLGAPGGGKSYEAVAYHVIPALAEGRKVITNLPLNLEAFPPEQRRLLEIRTETKAQPPQVDEHRSDAFIRRFGFQPKEKPFSKRAFANPEDYGDEWRHPETGAGPLYVIDECHLCLPRTGTPIAVAEWYSLHRHEFADVLLITQSYGKVQRDIVDLVQVCYRVRKATALGFSSKYIRKVFDGVKGECMNENVREYDKAYFKFYRSHTRSSKAGQELEAKDIVPIWKHWTFKGAALMCIIAIVIFSYTGAWNPMKTNVPAKASASSSKPAAAGPAPMQARAGTSTPNASAPVSVEAAHEVVTVDKTGSKHPLAGYGLHISGVVHNARKTLYMFTVSQNGQAVYNLNQIDLVSAGYEVKPLNDCIVQVTFGNSQFHATCDAPRVSVTPAVTMKS